MSIGTRPQLQYLHDAIEDLKAKHLYFHLKILHGEQKPVANFDGQEVINLSSNNYLGLTTHPKLRRAAIAATRKFGVGSGAVRTIAGTMKMHMDLEAQIAAFKKVEACVVFQSGFAANAGTVSAILGKDDLVISDELNHASIIDGCRLSRATIKVFKHKDAADCERLLEETKDWNGKKLLISDGVFSMEGDIANLPALCDLAEKYNCIMMVDDAHSSGVLGSRGRGTIDHLNCHGRVDIQVGTLSKAIGSRTAISFFHFASAVRDGYLPGRIRAAGFRSRGEADQEALGQYKIFQAQTEEAGIQHGQERDAYYAHPGRRSGQGVPIFAGIIC